MKNNLFLITILLFSFVVSAYSKEGKIKITGEITYEGEVNDTKIPNGNGVIKYKKSTLGASGSFNGYTVSNGVLRLSYGISFLGDFEISIPDNTTSLLDYTLKNGRLVLSGVEYILDTEYKVGTQKYSSYFSHYFYESKILVYKENEECKAIGTLDLKARAVTIDSVEYKDGIIFSKLANDKWKKIINDNHFKVGNWIGFEQLDRTKFSTELYHKAITSLNCVINATIVTGFNSRRVFEGKVYPIVRGNIKYDSGAEFNGYFADIVDENGNNKILYYEGTYEENGIKDVWESAENKSAIQREKERLQQEQERKKEEAKRKAEENRRLVSTHKNSPVKQSLIGRSYYNVDGKDDQVAYQGYACYKLRTNTFQFKSSYKVKFIDNIKMYEINSYGEKGRCILDTNALEYTFNCIMIGNSIYIYANESDPVVLTYDPVKNILISEDGDEFKQKKQ